MKILVVGSGGREHALCAKIAQSPLADAVYCAPGNPGIAHMPRCEVVKAKSAKLIFDFARYNDIDLVVIGSEAPLAEGLADWLREKNIRVFGPNKCAAEIETSKLFGKLFMDRHGIPTAPWAMVNRRSTARRVITGFAGPPIVLKADGFAGGKGVFVANNKSELNDALEALFVDRPFGSASNLVIVEEKMRGLEVTATCITDGNHVLMLPDAMDYKQAEEGDLGPNTGGMGAHSPSFALDDELCEYIRIEIMQKTVYGLRKENRAFRGALTAGLIIDSERKVNVLEFNARFNDPECQTQLLRIDEDVVPILASAAEGKLARDTIATKDIVAANVVLTSAPYPDKAPAGEEITGIAMAERCGDVTIFHAGTAQKQDKLVTSGGRVLNVCASSPTLKDALKKAYGAASLIDWHSKALRSDIGWRVLKET